MNSAVETTTTDTIIVGAGFAGLGIGIRLRRQGEESFVILERSGDVGGTWRDNVYPGVACDIPSHLYSYSFRQNAHWSKLFADGSEILEYLRQAVLEEGLLPHLRFHEEASSMRWDEESRRWIVQTPRGIYVSRVLIIAAGRLSEPRLPEVPGLGSFEGQIFHSSRWRPGIELAGKRVGIVGTGASAVQILPKVSEQASDVVLFQRTPAYIVPRANRAYSELERRKLSLVPGALERHRSRLFWKAEMGFAERIGVPAFVDALRERALGHLEAQVPDPVLRTQLTPDYDIGCKRILLSDDFYPALAAGNVTLEPSAVSWAERNRIHAASGAGYDLDVLILATGFESTRPPFASRTVGASGILLSERWNRGMVAHASTTVAGFPNLFIMDGPNASLGHNSAVHMIETQIEHILGALAYLQTSGAAVLEVSRAAEDRYTADIDRRSASTVWLTGGCSSWYVDAGSHRLTLLWPDLASAFRCEVGTFDPAPYTAQPPGPTEPAVLAAAVGLNSGAGTP
jgi:cation diffusion facilitator CzcD-associated flavoprotein CzcO